MGPVSRSVHFLTKGGCPEHERNNIESQTRTTQRQAEQRRSQRRIEIDRRGAGKRFAKGTRKGLSVLHPKNNQRGVRRRRSVQTLKSQVSLWRCVKQASRLARGNT